jgi:hypothetical protein
MYRRGGKPHDSALIPLPAERRGDHFCGHDPAYPDYAAGYLSVHPEHDKPDMQVREEAIAAANKAIELSMGNELWTFPAQSLDIDINNDSVNDYLVFIAAPVCVRATPANITTASSVTLLGFSSTSAWNAVWELDATATEESSGTRVRVRHPVGLCHSGIDDSGRYRPVRRSVHCHQRLPECTHHSG